MPGPRNQKKKKPAQNKKGPAKKAPSPPPKPVEQVPDASSSAQVNSPSNSSQLTLHDSRGPSPTPPSATPPPTLTSTVSSTDPTHEPVLLHHGHDDYSHNMQEYLSYPPEHAIYPEAQYSTYAATFPYPEESAGAPPIPSSLLKPPFIHDPGSGPRVKDVRAFLGSRLASPPSLDDPLCGEFADEAVLQMLCTVLPEETAMILWYNKSRATARICPACQRLYRLGDILPNHLANEEERGAEDASPPPFLAKEQELSGLCSPVCFILASYNYPGAIRSTWGRMAEELDDATWDLLDGPGQRANDMGLGMLLKMTRCHDLGLGQLFFPDLEFDSDETANEDDEGMGLGAKSVEDGAEAKDGHAVTGQVESEGVMEKMQALRLEDAIAAPVLAS
ncbi:hypothetical protein GSI_11816 [Ganoderma sinense ZZ0214-1]|uniref:Uncharacterized protein n=1 Tax=Ganoderma sinense ZZ0214-1 TaxID=1077348 RepID=A0A2G8RX27_9APHY|nr:hypothetical protein GSI_11816 [Ganoderma sinense ZZ0214-1]